ncbi:MAG: ATP-dependent Clp protease ATP-binding subunit ClpC [Solirubrobacteraceae bacterium]|jgi:ATP-dependent Clp protease ATP-binding subunit ClpC|nr:ATP-dependent Clp protease ATP-binding subunit ClpC [Solirubrobacteraceae bacterium]
MLKCVFERFKEPARDVVVLAQDEARGLKHNYIGTEHILLGLLREEDGIAAQVLGSLGVTLEGARTQIVEIVGAGEEATPGQVPFTPGAKKVLELSLREALSLGHNYIDTEHILLGLARENEDVANRVLLASGADTKRLRDQVIALVPGPSLPSAAQKAGQVSGVDAWIHVGLASSLRRLLMFAAARALDDGRDRITENDLLLALTRDEKTGPLLASLGVDEAAVRDAIGRGAASDEPPAASAS